MVSTKERPSLFDHYYMASELTLKKDELVPYNCHYINQSLEFPKVQFRKKTNDFLFISKATFESDPCQCTHKCKCQEMKKNIFLVNEENPNILTRLSPIYLGVVTADAFMIIVTDLEKNQRSTTFLRFIPKHLKSKPEFCMAWETWEILKVNHNQQNMNTLSPDWAHFSNEECWFEFTQLFEYMVQKGKFETFSKLEHFDMEDLHRLTSHYCSHFHCLSTSGKSIPCLPNFSFNIVYLTRKDDEKMTGFYVLISIELNKFQYAQHFCVQKDQTTREEVLDRFLELTDELNLYSKTKNDIVELNAYPVYDYEYKGELSPYDVLSQSADRIIQNSHTLNDYDQWTVLSYPCDVSHIPWEFHFTMFPIVQTMDELINK